MRPSPASSPRGCARGKERRETIWFRDADVAEAIDAILFVGLADWYPPNYDCGACGYATCAEFLHATKPCERLRRARVRRAPLQPARHRPRHRRRLRGQDRRHPLHRLPLPDPHRRRGPQARHHQADIAVALSLSLTHKAVGFDRRIADVDFDALDYPPTGTLPVGVEGGERHGGIRNRQQPRRPPSTLNHAHRLSTGPIPPPPAALPPRLPARLFSAVPHAHRPRPRPLAHLLSPRPWNAIRSRAAPYPGGGFFVENSLEAPPPPVAKTPAPACSPSPSHRCSSVSRCAQEQQPRAEPGGDRLRRRVLGSTSASTEQRAFTTNRPRLLTERAVDELGVLLEPLGALFQRDRCLPS